MPTGQFTAADLAQAPSAPPQTGQYSAADLATPSAGTPTYSATATAPAPQGGALGRFTSNFLKAVNPFPALKHYLIDLPEQDTAAIQQDLHTGDYWGALGHIVQAATPGGHFLPDTVRAQAHQFVQAYKDLQDTQQMPSLPARLASAGGHALAGAVPLVGPAAANAGEQIGSGDVAGGLGSGAGLIASVVAPEAVKSAAPKAAEAVSNAVKLPRSGTPEQQAAVDWALQHGAPLDAAAATLNPVVRGTQEIARHTLGAGSTAEKAIEERNQWYAEKGRELAGEAHPEPQTPETAGRAVAEQGVQTIRGANAEANDAYAALRAREQNPKSWAEVQNGTQPETREMQVGTKQVPVPGVVNPDGSPAVREEPVFQNVTREVPVTEKMPMPVDMREYKAQLAPVLTELQRATRLGQAQYAPAQMALEDLVHGPDFKPASAAEKDLSALKEVSRKNTLTGGVKNDAGALAASLIPRLQDAIDDAVSTHGGPDALKDLQTGRLETSGKYGAINLVDQFREEPVKLFNQLTATKDGAIDLLRKVQNLAPDQMPALGRAWLDGALNHATESGGFAHADKLFSDWQKLGDQTKQILFPNPALRSDLDKFFQSAKDSSAVENKSGTAKVAYIGEQGALLITHPLAAAAEIAGGNLLTRLLYNPRFVRAAIRAMKTPRNSAGAPAAAARLAEAAKTGTAGTPGAMASGAVSAAESEQNGAAGAARVPVRAGSAGESGAVSGAAGAGGGAGAAESFGPGGGRGSRATYIPVPGESGNGYRAQYAFRELNQVQPSHSGPTFLPNPKYTLKNDRDYANPVNQSKIVTASSPAAFEPGFHVTDNPDATNGPIVTDEQGQVLGGNGRTMILQRVNATNPKGAIAYRNLLAQKAAQFGLNAEALKGMKRPVLVREIPDSEFAGRTKQQALTDFNKKGTAELTPAERAIADSRRVSPDTLEEVARRLDEKGANATLADVLEGASGGEVLEKLIADGVVTPQERAAFVGRNGELTPAGKSRIRQLLLGRFFRDPDELDTFPPSLRNKIERIAAPLAQVEGRGEWNLTPDVREAVGILDQAAKLRIKSVDDFIRQDGLFGKQKYSARAIAIANAIQKLNPTDLTKAVREYAADANFRAGGENLFGANPAPESSFREAFGTKSGAEREIEGRMMRPFPDVPFDEEHATVREALQKAQATYRPGRGGYSGILYINPAAREVLTQVGRVNPKQRWQNVTLDRPAAEAAIARLEFGMLRHPLGARKIFAIRKELARALQGNSKVVMVEAGPGRTIGEVKAGVRHELHHREEQDFTPEQAKNFLSDPLAHMAKHSLVARGYPDDPVEIASEIGAALREDPTGGSLDLTPEQSKVLVRRFARHYPGPFRFERIHPKLKEALREETASQGEPPVLGE